MKQTKITITLKTPVPTEHRVDREQSIDSDAISEHFFITSYF